MQGKRLYRTRSDQKLAGVCAGLSEYFRFDVTLVRLLFILLTLFNGIGLLLYLALWLIVPYQGQDEYRPEEVIRTGAEEIADRARTVADRISQGRSTENQRAIGIILILIGVFLALRSLGAIWWLSFGNLWPLLLVGLGTAIIVRRFSGDPQRQGGSLIGALILIAMGAFFLAQNFGFVDWQYLEGLWKFWPVLLILLGLDALFGRNSGGGAVAGILLALLLAAGALWLVGGLPFGGVAAPIPVSQVLDGASEAYVTVRHGAGQLRLGQHNASHLLLDGQVAAAPGALRQTFTLVGSTAHLELSSGRPTIFAERGSDWLWDLRLNPAVPTRLSVRLGAGEARLDLSALTITGLDVETGAGKTSLILPASGSFVARVQGGVGATEIIIPDGVAVRVEAGTGIGGTEVFGNFTRDGRYYVTPGYEQAQHRIDLRVENGIGKVSVRFQGW